MADVTAACPSCGHTCTISEHVETPTMPCPKCGAAVPVPTMAKSSELNLKKTKAKEFLVEFQEIEGHHPGVIPGEAAGPRGMDRVHISRTKVKTPKILVAWFTFLFVGVLLLGLQYAFEKYHDLSYLKEYYIWARAAIGALCLIVLLLTAFEDNVFQGIFCLLLLPYAVYYTFARSDSYMLRGALLALLVSISAELYFLGDQALWIQWQENVNAFINEGHGLIQRAGEAPTY